MGADTADLACRAGAAERRNPLFSAAGYLCCVPACNHPQPRFPTDEDPPSLQALIDDGVIDRVVRPLKSGKEAAVYVVGCGDVLCCAKVYKDMAQRSFQQRVQYQEGRKVRGSREARAIGQGQQVRPQAAGNGLEEHRSRCAVSVAARPACACRNRMAISMACW